MIKIGITGGIGSGKSVVSDIFRKHDIPVFDADKEAKMLNDNSRQVKESLIAHFGSFIYEGDKLRRDNLAKLIFEDEKNLAIANSIIHPALADTFLQWCDEHKKYQAVAIDAAVLFEAGFEKYLDAVVTVFAPEHIRIKRVMERDGVDKDKVLDRMRHQLSEEDKMKRADHVVYNDETRSLIEQVGNIMAYYNIR